MSVWRGCGGTGRFLHCIDEGGPWGKHGVPHGSEPKASDGHTSTSIRARRRSSARARRDLTVPRRQSSAAAVSSSESSRKYRHAITSRSSSRRPSTAASSSARSSDSSRAASGDGPAPPESGSSAARSASRSRRPADLRRFRASLATMRSTQGRKGASGRKRPRASNAFTKPSWTASSASAAEPVIRYAVRNAIVWCSSTRVWYAAESPLCASPTSSISASGRSPTAPGIHRPGGGSSRLACGEPVDRPLERDEEQPAPAIHSERAQRGHLEGMTPLRRHAPVLEDEAPDDSGAVVAVEVASERLGQLVPAIDVAARHRAADRVVVLEDRANEPPGPARLLVLEGVGALEDVPAEVDEPARARGKVVDLLPLALAHVGDVEAVGLGVEAEAPGVAEPVRGDFPLGAGAVDVEPKELPEPGVEILGAILRVAARAPVAHPHVEQPVGSEGELAAVMVRVRLLDEEELVHPPGLSARARGVRRRHEWAPRGPRRPRSGGGPSRSPAWAQAAPPPSSPPRSWRRARSRRAGRKASGGHRPRRPRRTRRVRARARGRRRDPGWALCSSYGLRLRARIGSRTRRRCGFSSAPSGDAAQLLGRGYQARVPTRPQARLEALGRAREGSGAA